MTQRKTSIIIFLLSLVTIILSISGYKLSKKQKFLSNQLSEALKEIKLDRESFLKINGILKKDNNGFDILVMGNDFVSGCIYFGNQWEPHLQNALKQLVKPGNKALVLGTHIGYHALLISKLVGSEGHVSMFEANPDAIKFVKANLAFNNVQNATLFPKAAFSENTTLQFVATKHTDIRSNKTVNTAGAYVLRPESKRKGGNEVDSSELITVEAVSIDSIKEIESIDVLQMDIEGSEAQAVFGATKLIDNSPNLIVFQEWAPDMLGQDVPKLLEFWRSRGYRIAEIKNDSLKELSDDELINSESIDIIIAKNLDEIIHNFKPL